MSFTLTQPLEQLPSYPLLCKLAEQNNVRVIGDEHAGSFSHRGVDGDYELDAKGIHGRFTGHGVVGEFSFEIGKAAVTVLKKPFWLPEALLKQKIMDGLNTLLKKLA